MADSFGNTETSASTPTGSAQNPWAAPRLPLDQTGENAPLNQRLAGADQASAAQNQTLGSTPARPSGDNADVQNLRLNLNNALAPLHRMGGQMVILANVVMSGFEAVIAHLGGGGFDAPRPRNELHDSIDPTSGAALFSVSHPEKMAIDNTNAVAEGRDAPHDTSALTDKERADYEAAVKQAQDAFGHDVGAFEGNADAAARDTGGAVVIGQTPPEGAMIRAPGGANPFGKPPVDPTLPPPSPNDPHGMTSFTKGANAEPPYDSVGGDASAVQKNPLDGRADGPTASDALAADRAFGTPAPSASPFAALDTPSAPREPSAEGVTPESRDALQEALGRGVSDGRRNET